MEYILIFFSGAIIGFVIGKGPSNKAIATDPCNHYMVTAPGGKGLVCTKCGFHYGVGR